MVLYIDGPPLVPPAYRGPARQAPALVAIIPRSVKHLTGDVA
jgi:hypothetical protein